MRWSCEWFIALVRIPANTVAPGFPGESTVRRSDSSLGGPQMAQENLFFKPLPAAARPALGYPTVHGSPQSDERHPLALSTRQTPTVGLAPERDCLSALGLSDAVVSTLQNARAFFKRSLYAGNQGYIHTLTFCLICSSFRCALRCQTPLNTKQTDYDIKIKVLIDVHSSILYCKEETAVITL
ncbi:UNVERIFIED_CONTAM: hypothetical protein FKN15_048328 [Acipenser sinensis]